MAGTILKLGWTNPLTDAFGAHPQLGAVLDLNDGVTFTLVAPDGLDLAPPPRTLALAGNIRTQGERGTRAIYRHNRQATARVLLGPMANYGDLAATLRTLLLWLDAPPSVPFAIQYQPPGASAPLYLDVVGAAHDLPADEGQWLRLQIEPLELVFVCRPGLRGARQTLSNLVVNPGFEAPSGPGVTVFADAFTGGFGAYSVQAGGALAQDKVTYADTVLSDAPLRYYRLDEASGMVAVDASAQGQNGSYLNAPTLGVTGLLTGDSDAAITLAAASSQRVTSPNTGLPTGNSPLTLECLVKVAAYPGASQYLLGYGNGTQTNHQDLQVSINATGHLVVDVGGAAVLTSTGAVSTGAAHYVCVTWDGTTLSLYVDALSPQTAMPGAQGIPSGLVCFAGSYVSGGFYFSGTLDEWAVYGVALSAARIAAHQSAATTAPSVAAANTMVVANGGRVSFGSPNWSAINTWQLRVRYVSGLSATFYLHYTDANNYLAATLGGGQLALVQSVAGVAHSLGTVSVTPVNGVAYWLRLTQFPAVPGDPPLAQATLLGESAGAVGAPLATTGSVPAYDAVTALAGAPQIAAAGAALALGGGSASVGHSVALFGRGGWSFAGQNGTATGQGVGAWDAATTFPTGPATSFAAARIDLPPAGTVDARWRLYTGGAPAGTQAIALASTPATLGLAAWTKSAGLAGTATTQILVSEYDASGAFLRSGVVGALGGTQVNWAQLAGTYTTGAGCAYVDVALEVADATAGSANGTVWLDNAQCWNMTATGQNTMPYCELRFPQAPAQLLVSGLLGDLPAPAFLAFGTYLASWPAGSTLGFALGRRAGVSANAQLVGNSVGLYASGSTPTTTAALDPTSYGGYYALATVTSGGWNPRAFSLRQGDARGTYHVWARFLSKQTLGNLGNVQARVYAPQRAQPWFGASDQSDTLGAYYGPWAAPLAASNTWTVADAGQVAIPPFNQGPLTDPAQNYLTPRAQWEDLTTGGAVGQANWQLLLPVDGSLLVGVLNNATNSPVAVAGRWLWAYADGLGSSLGQAAAWTYSLEAAALPAPAHGAGGPGTQTTGSININAGADPYLTLDPTQQLGGAGGVNQLAASLADGAATVLAFHAEIVYAPLYLEPR